ncbi:hypothetical protein ACFL41_00370 [Gemmatimonadota bacterium]
MSCSDNPTTPDESDVFTEDDRQVLFFTDSIPNTWYPVESYAIGDSVYITALEFDNLKPGFAPLWIYAHESRDKEMYLMHSYHHIIPETERWRFSILPNAETGISPFNGVLRVMATGDSITAHYFSQTLEKMVTVGARIGGP